MDHTTAVTKLKTAADKVGIVSVLALCGNNLKFRIPMTKAFWDSSIENLSLSVRSYNGLRRADADTIGKVSEIIMNEKGLSTVRNLGRKSVSEIKTALMAAGYEQLNDQEKLDFWQYFVANNF